MAAEILYSVLETTRNAGVDAHAYLELAVERAQDGLPREVPVAMARLYAANLAGAVLGTVAAPHLLFPALGLTGTLLAVGAVQGVVVTTALFLGRGPRAAAGAGASSGRALALALVLASADGRLLAAIAALSGYVVFACEVLWIHLIGVTLGMSVYAFALMLTAVLLGLFFGGLLVSLVAARRAGAGDWLLPLVLALGAVSLTVTFGRWDEVPEWLLYWRTVSDFGQGKRLRLEISLLMVGVSSVALGMVYPSLFRLSYFPLARADGAAGVLGAANALGSISGVLVTAFWLLLAPGAATTYRVLASLPALAAVGLLGQLLARSTHRRAAGIAFGAPRRHRRQRPRPSRSRGAGQLCPPPATRPGAAHAGRRRPGPHRAQAPLLGRYRRRRPAVAALPPGADGATPTLPRVPRPGPGTAKQCG